MLLDIHNLHRARLGSYAVFLLFSTLTWILAAAYVNQFEKWAKYHPSSGDALIAAGVLGDIAVIVFLVVQSKFSRAGAATSLAVEIGMVFVLWALFLGCSAATVADWSWAVYGSCSRVSSCQIGQAAAAFGFLSFFVLTFVLGLLIYRGVQSRAWTVPFGSAGKSGPTKEATSGHSAPGHSTTQV